MIPLKLTLSNFLSYGENTEPLDFSQIHIACISGPNGNGKSAMVDGLTWPIWGYARGKSDDDLIRLGSEEMMVELEFELEDNIYRIIRKRSKKGRGKSDLQFQIKNGDTFNSISGSTLKETQAKIIDTLKMDYTTFVNSACILQGRSDEFTNSTPGERKEVLSQILGLSRFDKLQEKAKDRLKEISLALESVEAEIIENELALQEKASFEDLLKKSETNAKNEKENISLGETAIKLLQDKRSALLVQQSQVVTQQKLIEELSKQGEECNKERTLLAGKKTKYTNILAHKEEILKKAANLELLIRSEADMLLSYKKQVALKTERADLNSEFDRVIFDFKQGKIKRINALEAEAYKLISAHDHALADYNRKMNAEIHAIELAESELKNIKERSILLGPKDCKRSDCSFLKSALEMATKIPAAELKLKNLKEAPELVAPMKPDRIFQIDSEKETIEAEKGPQCPTRLEQVEIEIEMLEYSESEHKKLQIQIEEHKKYAQLKPELDQAETGIKDLEEQDATVIVKLSDIARKITVLKKEQEKLIEIASELSLIVGQIAAKEDTLKATKESLEAVKQDITRASMGLENCKKIEENIKKSKAKIAEQSQEKILYTELEKAFSRNGIPALLIDNAIPQIEEEANIILSKITEGKLKVQLSTQKDLKTGGTAETLDILISDALGTRVYEMYSGGEAFRVNFALRIALSKILAYRSGAKLQTLIIDEGFGTQDMDGVIRLKEVINGISNDFKLILIITHIQEFKNAFPIRIEIEKDPVTGSKFKVIEN